MFRIAILMKGNKKVERKTGKPFAMQAIVLGVIFLISPLLANAKCISRTVGEWTFSDCDLGAKAANGDLGKFEKREEQSNGHGSSFLAEEPEPDQQPEAGRVPGKGLDVSADRGKFSVEPDGLPEGKSRPHLNLKMTH